MHLSSPPKSRRRWFQFSLRTLLALATLCCTALGIWAAYVRPYRHEQRAVREIRAVAGTFRASPFGPSWLRALVGEVYFMRIVEVDVSLYAGKLASPQGPATLQEENLELLQALAKLDRLRKLTLFGGKLSDLGIATLAGQHNVHEIVLRSCRIQGRLELLGNCEKLRSVTFDECAWGRSSTESVSGLTQIESLEIDPVLFDLELADKGLPWDPSDLRHLSTCKNLKTLSLRRGELNDACFQHLAKLPELQHLDLSHNRILGGGLAQLTVLRQLRTLKLGGNPIHDEALADLEFMTQLEELDLRGTSITDRGLRGVGRLFALKSLDLSNTEIGDEGLRELAGLSSLEWLSLAETRVFGTGLEHMVTNRGLAKIDLSFSQFEEAGAQWLQMLPIEQLDLRHTRVSDEVFDSLWTIESLRELKIGPHGVKQASIAHFVRATGGRVNVEFLAP